MRDCDIGSLSSIPDSQTESPDRNKQIGPKKILFVTAVGTIVVLYLPHCDRQRAQGIQVIKILHQFTDLVVLAKPDGS